MSLINKMLEDLDRRNAAVGTDAPVPPGLIRPVAASRAGREWFWRVLAALIVVALGWVGWVAYKLQPRPLATDDALRAAQQARSRPITAAPAKPVAEAPKPPPAAAEPPKPESLKLALSIEKPQPEAAPAPPKEIAKAEPVRKPEPPAVVAEPKPAAAAGKVVRQDRVRTPEEKAEGEFRRAAVLLNQGRGAEAEEGFVAALLADRRHQGARQALIALLMERGQLERARRLLQDGLAIDPGQPEFALALGRIQVESGDLPGALATLQGAAAAEHPGLQVLRGTVLQRLGRHPEAADAYRVALRARSENPQAWVGLGISLEALKQRPEAAEAFQRALAAGPANAELKVFAEQRIRALR